jgi:segregation and condensation protein B
MTSTVEDQDPSDLELPESEPILPPDISLPAALESLLIIAADPMTQADLAAATGTDAESVAAALRALSAEYAEAGRGFELRQVADGWRFYSAAACAPVVHRWVTDGKQSRLSQAALETLAVIAYRQPVSRAKVGSIRGVSVDAVVRTLQARGLIEQTAEDPVTGAALYSTTTTFLERMGIAALTELPPIVDLLPDPDEVSDHVDGEALDLP